MKINKIIKLLVITVVLLSLLPVLPLQAQDEGPRSGGTMQIGINGDVLSFNTILNFWYRSCTYQVNVSFSPPI